MAESMTSVDLTEFWQEQSSAGVRCTIGILLEDMPPERADQLREALATPRLQSSAIGRVLKNWGYALDPQTVNRHRRGDCRCLRD